MTSAGKFYLESTDKKVRIHPRCKCLSSHSLTKELGCFRPCIKHLWCDRFRLPGNSLEGSSDIWGLLGQLGPG